MKSGQRYSTIFFGRTIEVFFFAPIIKKNLTSHGKPEFTVGLFCAMTRHFFCKGPGTKKNRAEDRQKKTDSSCPHGKQTYVRFLQYIVHEPHKEAFFLYKRPLFWSLVAPGTELG